MGYVEKSLRAPRRRVGTASRQDRGFTLVELLIVMVVAAVVLAIGAPQFSEFRRNNRLSGASNDLLAALQLARTEAIKRQLPVAVCATSNPQADEPVCTAGPFSGWLVFEDADSDCQRTPGEPAPIRAEGPLDGSLSTAADGVCAAFAPTGFALELPVGVETERVLICDDRGTGLQAGTTQSAARGISIARTGRAAITRDPDVLAEWGLPCS